MEALAQIQHLRAGAPAPHLWAARRVGPAPADNRRHRQQMRRPQPAQHVAQQVVADSGVERRDVAAAACGGGSSSCGRWCEVRESARRPRRKGRGVEAEGAGAAAEAAGFRALQVTRLCRLRGNLLQRVGACGGAGERGAEVRSRGSHMELGRNSAGPVRQMTPRRMSRLRMQITVKVSVCVSSGVAAAERPARSEEGMGRGCCRMGSRIEACKR
eukprot:365148-Chlamydomonas_euryale.AAC.13